MNTRKTQVDNYIAHTNQLMGALTFFGKNYIGEDKRNLSATYSYAYWLLCQSIDLIDEGENIYKMISTSLMYDFKEELGEVNYNYIQAYSSLKDAFFEVLDWDERFSSEHKKDAQLISLLKKYISNVYNNKMPFNDACKIITKTKEELRDAGIVIYRLLEYTLIIIKKQFARYRNLRNRTEHEYTTLWLDFLQGYRDSDLYRKDLDGYLFVLSQKLNDNATDEGKLDLYKTLFYKTIDEIHSIPELGDIWRRAAGNHAELACNLIRNECKDEYSYNRFISLICFVGFLDSEIVELQMKLNPQRVEKKTIKKKGNPGRKKTICFIDKIDVTKLAQSIKTIHNCYFSLTSKQIIIEGYSFNQTDFLISIYFSLVQLKLATSALENVTTQYYAFLKDVCNIELVNIQRTYDSRFAKLRADANDFHNLNDATIAKFENSGGFSKEEFPLWQQMVAIAEEELKGDEYIKSILKLNNGNSSESFQYE